MIGVPPICQSPDGNGGESNGDGGMRRSEGAALPVSFNDWVCPLVGPAAKQETRAPVTASAARQGPKPAKRERGAFGAIIQFRRGRTKRRASLFLPLESGVAGARVFDEPRPKRRRRLRAVGRIKETGFPFVLFDPPLPNLETRHRARLFR